MANLSDLLARNFTTHGVELMRYATLSTRNVLKMLLDLQDELVRKLISSRLGEAERGRLAALLRSTRQTLTEGYSAIEQQVASGFRDLALTEASVTARIMNSALTVDFLSPELPSSTLKALTSKTLVLGAPSHEWWGKQAAETAFRFAQQMRLGITQGETNAQLVQRVRGTATVPGLLRTSGRNAEALVRTSVLTVSNAARLATFKANADVLKGVQQVSTLDNRTTDVCIAYDLATWDLEGEPTGKTKLPFNGGPPRHWNCRSVLVPLTKSWEELGTKAKKEFDSPGARAAMDGQTAAALTYEEWLAGQSQKQQDEVLGAGRAQLWRDGKIGLTDLINQRGRPLTLGQLQEKYGVAA